MLKLNEYNAIFVTVGAIGVLLCTSPASSLILHLPSGEKFSEFWILGPGHMAENYPFNVSAGESYLIYVGISSHMGCSSYYVVYAKFRNQSEPLPNVKTGTASPVPPLYEYGVFLQNGKSWEAPLNFSFSNVSVFENQSLVRSIRINDVVFNVDKLTVWDSNNTGYYYQLFLELWIYNPEADVLQFHNRFVGIWLNITSKM